MKNNFKFVVQISILSSFGLIIGMEPQHKRSRLGSLENTTHLFAIEQSTRQYSSESPIYVESMQQQFMRQLNEAAHNLDENKPEPFIFQFLEQPNPDLEEFRRLILEEEPGMLLSRNKKGQTPLHYLVCKINHAAIKTILQILEYFKDSDVDLINEVLNARDTRGWTPLHLATNIACKRCDDFCAYWIFEYLIDNPYTDINALTLRNNTPFDIALSTMGMHVDCDDRVECLNGEYVYKKFIEKKASRTPGIADDTFMTMQWKIRTEEAAISAARSEKRLERESAEIRRRFTRPPATPEEVSAAARWLRFYMR